MSDKEVRALPVHPAAWDGIVRFLDQRGIDVDPVGDLEGIPTFSMGVRSLNVPPAPSVGADPEDEVGREAREDAEDWKHHATFIPKLAGGAE